MALLDQLIDEAARHGSAIMTMMQTPSSDYRETKGLMFFAVCAMTPATNAWSRKSVCQRRYD